MNVVGKVGSLISQGVYSVATPFHPFGGAVDIIAVQQQDGSFRSTPWYVRFGKFQGVLKGAEKIVKINVNGVEANFHMYLDNSGEAYFVREVDSGQECETNGLLKDGIGRGGGTQNDGGDASMNNNDNANKGYPENHHRLHSTLSDPGAVIDEYPSLRPDRLERSESDACKFYDFQDEPSSLDGSVELSSEYGSSRYDNIDGMENFAEAQGSDSEMVLVSVDGHILTAPISSSEQNADGLELGTPQFHLGPGDSSEFVEGSGEFIVSEKVWAAGCFNGLQSSSKIDFPVDKLSSDSLEHQANNDTEEVKKVDQDVQIVDMHQTSSCKVGGETAHPDDQTVRDIGPLEDSQHGEAYVVVDEERDPQLDASISIDREARSSSCLKPSNLTTQAADYDLQIDDLGIEVQVVSERVQDNKPSLSLQSSDDNSSEQSPEKHTPDVESATKPEGSALDKSGIDGRPAASASDPFAKEEEQQRKIVMAVEVTGCSNCSPANSSLEHKDEHSSNVVTASTPEIDTSIAETIRSEGLQPQVTGSGEASDANPSLRCEVSLCGHLLRPGMGLDAAADAFNAHRVSEEEYNRSLTSIVKNENLVVRFRERYLLWDKAAPVVLGMAAFGLAFPVEPKDVIPVEQEEMQRPEGIDSGSASTPGRRWRLWSIPFRRSKTLQYSSSNISNDDIFVDSYSVSQNPSLEPTLTSQASIPSSDSGSKLPLQKILRTNIPTSDQIASLNLKDGQNMVTFSFNTRVLGLQQVDAHIYLWKWNARIVISDVDGTITKSDVLGQFMPLVGKDWTQSGVARLFCAIKENGYQLLFLSARAIVQAYLTRSFLVNLKQDGKTLPNGPIVISPDGLFPSLYREVIRRAPHEFKIACLEDIKALFPPDYNPFYAGFGNRDTDELSYRKIGIPKGKIFIINPKGEVAINNRIDVKSYTSLHTLVNDMFPPTSLVEQEDYNSWNYWRMPLSEIDA
ncbi:hypothetical protein Dimus_034570 [Dionaea muscipula]